MLCVLNIGFFAWSQWIDVPASAAPTPKPAAVLPSLQLIGAAPASALHAPTAPSQDLPQRPPATSTRCRSLGPFNDPLAATAESDRLRARGWQPRERSTQSQVLDGYWVYLPDLKDSAAQRSALARLSAAGIHDAAAVTEPEQNDRVSVGFFADQAHAVRRAEQVRALGYKPILDVHQRSANQDWIDFTLKAGEPEPTVADVLAADPAAVASGAAPQLIPCPT